MNGSAWLIFTAVIEAASIFRGQQQLQKHLTVFHEQWHLGCLRPERHRDWGTTLELLNGKLVWIRKFCSLSLLPKSMKMYWSGTWDLWGEHVSGSEVNLGHYSAFRRRVALLLTSKRDRKCGMHVGGRSPRLKRGRSCEGYTVQLHKGQRSFQLNQTSKHRG